MNNHSVNFKQIAQEIRRQMVSVLVPKESSHIGCSLSIVDILVMLYFKILKVYPKNPSDPKRDIFILSKGHGALALYGVLCEKRFFTKKLLEEYDVNGGSLPEHASNNIPGVEVSTGSLGHGLPIGVGFATSFLNDKKSNKVFVLVSDGELNEGSNWEAIMYAGHHNLNNLVVIEDMNGMQAYATTEKVINLLPIRRKLKEFHWNTYQVNGHDYKALEKIFFKISHTRNKLPHWIVANTIKGKGVSYWEGKFESHYKSVDSETKEKILNELICY